MPQRLFLALLVIACSTLSLRSYPISPVTLWDLIKNSQLIVLADVIEITKAPPLSATELADPTRSPDEIFRDATARLRIRETWKGEPLAGVDVKFPDSLICPAPPRYVPGKVVLAFLSRNKEAWETTALSYGTIYPRREDVAGFRDLVLRAVTLQLAKDVSDNAIAEWHVEAASLPGTRWHGLYFLAPESDALHSYYDRRDKSAMTNQLTPTELRQIADAFIATPPTDRTLPMALAVLSEFPDESVSLAAASALEALLREDAVPWWIKSALGRILQRYGDTDVETRLRPLGDKFADVSPDQVRTLWENARKELAIPKVSPAKILDEEVWGVASNTPS